MRSPKKSWRFFWTVSAVFWALDGLCAVIFGIWAVPIGLALWGIALARFRSIRYELDEHGIRIISGLLIRSAKTVKLDNILYESTLLVGGRFLCLRLHTAGGSATVFCDFDRTF